MSSNDITPTDGLIQSFRYEGIVCLTLVIWECVVSCTKEWRLVQSKSPARFRYIYVACRLYPLAPLGITIYLWFIASVPSNCRTLTILQSSLLLVTQIFPHAILSYRCWIFGEKRTVLAVFLSVILILTFGLQAIVMSLSHVLLEDESLVSSKAGCIRDTLSTSERLAGYAVMGGSFIDAVAVFVVLWEYYKIRKPVKACRKLARMIVKHTLYCSAIILAITIVAGISYMSKDIRLRGKGFLTIMMARSILACHSTLKLREGVPRSTESQTERELSRLIQEAFGSDE
ncbi:hypothetical protein BDN72DRAFT_905288 [Pluteus cervinus]|uniref:Uncharacterized protein n=1 Tax=Pluteus cervinus TaxID=181527 RepID=A0ACD3A3G0_9AGAR|nr:hypothetical protein BDN72DRAFT_905288 [Pluteus cervinus]